MSYSRTTDTVKSLASFAVVELLLFFVLYFVLPWLLKPSFIKDHMLETARESLDEDVLNLTVGQITGYVQAVAWTVFAVTQTIALMWLIYAWSVRIYKPGVARHHLPVHVIVLALGVPLIGALVAFDGYFSYWFQIGLRGFLTEDFRAYLWGGVTIYCILCFLLATAIAVPPVMRRAAVGGTAFGAVTDALHVWEV